MRYGMLAKDGTETITYDTEADEHICSRTVGDYGDDDGYEESLLKHGGQLYVHGVGGPKSPYAQETILRVTKAQAKGRFEDFDG